MSSRMGGPDETVPGEEPEKEPLLPSAQRVSKFAGIAAGIIFWGWLVVRWLNDWFLSGVTGIGSQKPFVQPGVFENAASYFESFADSSNVVISKIGENLVGIFEFASIGVGFLPNLAHGAWLTIILTVVSIILGFFIALPLTLMRIYGDKSRLVALVYIELIRGTPLLAQLFFLYYALPLTRWFREIPFVGQGFFPEQAFWVAIVGFTINSAAYQSEYMRGSFMSVQSGQMTAARSVGLSKLDSIRYVIVPQGLRYSIPAWTNELVYLIKYSSLAAFITVPEIFYSSERIASRNFEYTTLFTLAAILYLGLVISASKLMRRVEKRVSIPGIGDAESR